MEQVLNTIYTYLAAYGLKIVAALEKLGVRMTSFVVIVGAAGLAIGFALQGSLANFVAGRSLWLTLVRKQNSVPVQSSKKNSFIRKGKSHEFGKRV